MALRRPAIFTAAIAVASFLTSLFWLAPFVCKTEEIASIFPIALEEIFFYDIFAWVAAAWLVSFVFFVCAMPAVGRFGQWVGIFLISMDQVVLYQQCAQLAHLQGSDANNVWVMPLLIEFWLICLYIGFFTLPALMKHDYKRLTGIATLAIVLPWLLGKDAIVLGSQVLTGLF